MRIVIGSAVLAAAILGSGTSNAQTIGDPAEGKKLFRQCQACHAVGEGAANKIGPVLNGIMSKKPATVEGYTYSPAFVEWAADKEQWTHELMSQWLADPRAVVPGTKMVYPGMADEEDRNNVIAYLASFDETGAEQDPASVLGQ